MNHESRKCSTGQDSGGISQLKLFPLSKYVYVCTKLTKGNQNKAHPGILETIVQHTCTHTLSHTHTFICVHTHILTHAHTHIFLHRHTHIFLHRHTHIHTQACTHTFIHMHVHMHYMTWSLPSALNSCDSLHESCTGLVPLKFHHGQE